MMDINRSEIKELLVSIFNEEEDTNEANIKVLTENQIFYSCTKIKFKSTGKKYIIKWLTKDSEERKQFPFIESWFLNEIYFYDTVLESLSKFAVEKNAGHFLDGILKCKTSNSKEFSEMLMWEDLEGNGYFNGRNLNYDHFHMELVFKEFAKYHAVVYAFKNQKPLEYSKLVNNILSDSSVVKTMLEHSKNLFVQLSNSLVEEKIVHYKFIQFSKRIESFIKYVMEIRTKYHIIILGNCGVMFKYNLSLSPSPSNIKLVDIQNATVASPVQDLAFHFYANTNEKILIHLDKYLRIYHKNLSENLKILGCNPENILPFDRLKDEWKVYGKYGFLLALPVIHRNAKINNFSNILNGGTAEDADKLKKLQAIAAHLAEFDLI